MFANLSSLESFGNLTCTPALSPVPRLEGQVRMKPRCSFHMNSCPVEIEEGKESDSICSNVIYTAWPWKLGERIMFDVRACVIGIPPDATYSYSLNVPLKCELG